MRRTEASLEATVRVVNLAGHGLPSGVEFRRAFLKNDLKDYGFQPSPMPAYQGKLSAQEMADLLTYLLSLKG